MFRKRVLAMDAIQAVICLECSQHTSVLLGATNVLHTKPSDDLQAEYDRLEQVILRAICRSMACHENVAFTVWRAQGDWSSAPSLRKIASTTTSTTTTTTTPVTTVPTMPTSCSTTTSWTWTRRRRNPGGGNARRSSELHGMRRSAVRATAP